MKSRIGLISVFLLILITNCVVNKQATHFSTVYPTDTPIEQFILGKWISIEAIDKNGNSLPYRYMIVFEEHEVIKYITLSTNGELLDGTTSHYEFINTHEIYIDNKRITNGENWVLKRDGQDLLVLRTIINSSASFRFTRYQ